MDLLFKKLYSRSNKVLESGLYMCCVSDNDDGGDGKRDKRLELIHAIIWIQYTSLS